MKCDVCKNTIATLFLQKIKGTIVKDAQGKRHPVCFECQKKFKSKEEILQHI